MLTKNIFGILLLNNLNKNNVLLLYKHKIDERLLHLLNYYVAELILCIVTEVTSLVPRPSIMRWEGLVSTACACARFPYTLP